MFLNTVGKLIEKVIGKKLQFQTTSNNFIHPSQLGDLKFKSTTDTRVALTYIIHSGWVKNLLMSTLTFDVSESFPSLNYQILTLILKKVGFDNCVVNFFTNYLIGRKTNYFWNNFTLPMFDVDVGVGQKSMLSPILLALYLLLFLYIIENHLKNLKILISIIL